MTDLRERLASIAFNKMAKRNESADVGWDDQAEDLREFWRQVVDDILRELSGIIVEVAVDEHDRDIKPAK